MSEADQLTPALRSLLDQARTAANRAYAPYSKFRVGSALQLESGEVITAANVENVSYGLTICAERAALVRAIAQHGPAIRIAAIAVANLNHAASSPCGACRQMLAEFAGPDASVVFSTSTGACVMSFAQVLPLAFEMESKQ